MSQQNNSADFDFDFSDLIVIGHGSAKNMHAAPAVKVHCAVKAKDKDGNYKEGQFTTAFVKFNNSALQSGLRDKPVFLFVTPAGETFLVEYKKELFPNLPEDRAKAINPNGRLASGVIADSLKKQFGFNATESSKSFTLSVGAPIKTAKDWTIYKLEMMDAVEDDDLEDEEEAVSASSSKPAVSDEF